MLKERKMIAMILAEFVGTAVLTGVVLAVGKSNVGLPYFVSIAAGLTIAAGTVMFGAVSGAHFNPAITIGLLTTRKIKALRAVLYIAAQLLGGIVAYLLYTYFVNAHWPNAGKFDSRVLVAEAVGTFVFALGWAAAVYNKLQNGRAAFAVGSALTIGILVASAGSGALLNPAVALGLRSWVWGTYVLGPILGAIIGFNLYALLFAPKDTLIAEEVAAVEGDDSEAEEPVKAKSETKSGKKKK